MDLIKPYTADRIEEKQMEQKRKHDVHAHDRDLEVGDAVFVRISPAEMLLGRRPRSRLDLIKPYTADRIEEKQMEQKRKHDVHAHDRDLEVGDAVFVRNYHHGDKWIPGTIQNRTGPVSFKVLLQDGRNRRCHQDQVRKRVVSVSNSPSSPVVESPAPVPETNSTSASVSETSVSDSTSTEIQPEKCPSHEVTPSIANSTPPVESTSEESTNKPDSQPKIYPARNRKPVIRYEPKW